jgi:hypothetical protein
VLFRSRLRQACCHPALLPFPEARLVEGSAKLDVLMESLETAISEGHKSLVFSQWPSLLRLVADRLDEQVRLMLGRDGAPLFCVREGGATLTCGGYAQAVELMPLHSGLVERRRVVMVAAAPDPQGCASGLTVAGELSTPAERPLGRVVTPTIPREDHMARITSAVGEGFEVTEAFWIDLDGDKKDELLFELGFPATVEGVPARALVGVLDDGRVSRLAQVEAKDSIAAAPRARIQGVMDPSVTGVLSVLITFEGGMQSGYTVQRVDAAGKVTRVFERGC